MKIETFVNKKEAGKQIRLSLFPVKEFFRITPTGVIFRKLGSDGDGRTIVLSTETLEIDTLESDRKVYTTIVTGVRLELTIAEAE